MSIRAVQSNFRFLIAVAAGLTCTAALAIGLTIWWLRSEAIHEASRDAGSLSFVLAEQTNRSVQSIDLMFNELQERIKVLGARTPNDFRRLLQGEDTHQLLTERMARLSHVASISLTDKNGWMVSSTNKWPLPPTDLSAREHYQHLKNNNDQGIYVTSPVGDRFKGIQTIYFAKRINDTNNEFLGMITIGIQLSYFQHIYESIASLHDLSFLFLRKDGTVIVRYPDQKDRAGEKMPAASPWHQLVSQGGGNYRSPGYFDGIARQIAVRPLRDYPLVINVAVSETAALSTWRIQTITIGIGTLLFLICSVFLLKLLSNQFHRLATSRAALVEKAEELERANSKADAALNNMSQGLAMFDSSARLIVCNQRYLEMYGLSPEIVRPGCTIREILDQRVATGSFYADDIEQYISNLETAIGQGKIANKIESLRDGRIISILSKPMEGGGWVGTHQEITEQKRAELNLLQREQELQTQNIRFDTALNNMAHGLVMYDAAYRIVVCNRQYIEMYGLSPEVVKPGCKFRELIEHRKSRGSFKGDVDEYCARILSGVAAGSILDHITEIPDGRKIHIINRPMENGGRVSMHLDITERKRMEAELVMQHQHLDTALNNMSQGICMFDAKKRLVVCNDRYAKMYHLPPELLKPGTPHNAIITHRVSHGILKGEKSEKAAHEKISVLSQLAADARSSRIDELADGCLICVTREPMAGGGWVATHEDIT